MILHASVILIMGLQLERRIPEQLSFQNDYTLKISTSVALIYITKY